MQLPMQRAPFDLDSVKNFLQETTTEDNNATNTLLIEAVILSSDIIKTQIGSISNSVNNTGEKKSSIQAHKKLTKTANQMAQHAKLQEKRAMKNNPTSALRNVIKTAKTYAAKVIPSGGKRKADESSSAHEASLPPRQVRKVSDGDKSQDAKDVPQPRVPRPSGGELIYHPWELRDALKNLEANIEKLSGTSNKNTQRSFRTRYKEEMINKGYAPFKISAMNNFAKKYVDGDENPPLFWNQKGGREYMSINELHAMLQEKGKRVGQGWSYADTKEAIYNAKKTRAAAEGNDIRQIAQPDKKTVDAYHSALKSMSNITERTAQSKTKHRDIAETSVRAMLSNFTGMLSAVAVIESAEQPIPTQFRFDASRASEGELVSRKIYATAMGVPESSVHFIPPHLISNTDDMAAMYVSRDVQGNTSEDRTVLVDISSTTNNSYGIHSSNVNSESRCNDLKIRLTNTITLAGQYLPVFIQLPGFSESEIPRSKVPNGVVLLEVKGLAPDGSINPFSNHIGYIALIRGNEKNCEAEVFRHYEQKVRQPSTDQIRRNLGLDPSHPISRAVITIDGGVPQLIAHMESAGQKVERNESLVKFHKNTSGVAQPNDTGDGHMRIRHHMKTLPSASASIALVGELNHLLSLAKSEGYLIIGSEKNTKIIEGMSKVPTALRKSYTEESIRRASAEPGWLGESLQAPDAFQCFKQLKRLYTNEEVKKWIDDAPTLVKMYVTNGCFDEDLATSLGYPEDSDASGQEHPQTASLSTQHHRQRLTIPTNQNLSNRLSSRTLEAAADAREKERQALVDEMRWCDGILKQNAAAEKKLHIHSGRPADSNSSLLQNDDTNDARRIAAIGRLSKSEATAFVMARSMSSKSDKTFKNKPANRGNATNLKATIDKLAANSDATLDKKEITWLYQAWKKYKDPLTLVQLDEADDEEDETDPIQAAPSVVLPAEIVVRTPNSPSIEQIASKSFIQNIELVNQARDCFVGCVFVDDHHRLAQLHLRDSLIRQIIPRIGSFRQSLQSYQTHWTIDALMDNIGPICDLMALTRRIVSNPESFSSTECLLRSTTAGVYRKVSTNVDKNVNNTALQGVGLYLDSDRGLFRASTSASGTNEKNFKWRYDMDLKESKNFESTSALSKRYPFNTPSLHTKGGYHGKFDDLQFCIGIGFDPTKDNACLTRQEGGLFVWSDATLNRLKESKAADDLETKKRILVCCMLEVFFHLMLDARIRSDIPLKAFRPFIVAHK